MANPTPWAVFVAALLPGFILAISLQTGVSIDPNDIMVDVTGQIIQETQGQGAANTFNFGMFVAGLLTTIGGIYGVYRLGPEYLLSGAFGFLGVFLFIFAPNIGIWILIIGAVIATLMSK